MIPAAAGPLRAFLQTEKGLRIAAQRQYLFAVDRQATKGQIREAVERRFGVSVTAVQTMIMPGKPRRVRRQLGRRADWKKAIVTVASGQKIEVK